MVAVFVDGIPPTTIAGVVNASTTNPQSLLLLLLIKILLPVLLQHPVSKMTATKHRKSSLVFRVVAVAIVLDCMAFIVFSTTIL